MAACGMLASTGGSSGSVAGRDAQSSTVVARHQVVRSAHGCMAARGRRERPPSGECREARGTHEARELGCPLPREPKARSSSHLKIHTPPLLRSAKRVYAWLPGSGLCGSSRSLAFGHSILCNGPKLSMRNSLGQLYHMSRIHLSGTENLVDHASPEGSFAEPSPHAHPAVATARPLHGREPAPDADTAAARSGEAWRPPYQHAAAAAGGRALCRAENEPSA